MAVQIQYRRGTQAQWTTVNPILAQGEPGYEYDTGRFKVGNGVDTWSVLPYSSGIQGATGPTGPQGIQGIQGPIGAIGPQGPIGLTGATGPQGIQGETGLTGEQGIQGETGPQGIQGIQGETGPQGPQGDQGIQGETGPQGIQGIQGETGPQGLQGEQGIQGIQGETGLTGPQGIQGEIGPQGIQGETGPQGIQGETGDTGPQGPQGIQGETGPQGIQGETGPQGIQGIQGEIGPQGIQGIQGEIGPEGPPGDLGTAVIGDLSDVVVTSPLQFQGLMYDGTNWVNSNIPNTYLVRNNTGSTLLKGTFVGAVGVEPSGRIDVAPFEVTGTENSELLAMGIVVSDISNGVNGEVMNFGTLTGLDTRGSTASSLAVGDETWAAGDVLYAHPTVDGKLTNVKPQHDLSVAFITIRHASAGQIAIRVLPENNHLEWMHDVSIASPQNGETLQYNSGLGLWINERSTPAGSVQMFAGSTSPSGWLLCDGSAVNRTTYGALFATIGVTYGSGDGSTTFNLPDMRSRMPIGAGTGTGLTNRTLGGSGGGETKAINSANLPTHTHTIDHDHPATGSGTESADHAHYTSGGTGLPDANHSHAIGIRFAGYAGGGNGMYIADGGFPAQYNSGTVSAWHAHSWGNWSGGRNAAHTHTTDLGNFTGSSGNGGFANTPLDVVNPFLSLNFIIKV